MRVAAENVMESSPAGGPPARDAWTQVRGEHYARVHRLAALLWQGARSGWTYLVQHQAAPLLARRQRRLRITETVSLGEKRSVAILEVDGQAFLVASSGANISLLATLEPQQPAFQHVLSASFSQGDVR